MSATESDDAEAQRIWDQQVDIGERFAGWHMRRSARGCAPGGRLNASTSTMPTTRMTMNRLNTVARADDIHTIPDDLPVPTDDGAADHLLNAAVPALALPATNGETIDLRELEGRTVLFCYPRTGRPDQELPPGWDAIPGARGCTPEACGFRDAHAQFADLGVRVLALSTQDHAYQQEMADRLHLPFPVLSDEQLELTRELGLPTFETSGWTLLKRLTLVIDDGTIRQVFYPVFPPDGHAAEVLAWLGRG